MKSSSVTIQMKAMEQYFPVLVVLLDITMQKLGFLIFEICGVLSTVGLAFEFMDVTSESFIK